ncbi:demethylmenaquinone methyltransferase [Paenibacillus crassostreae]|uniref:Demethylmenaquinone methyltransferase n=1 Tax=Paenibacillus crassostreae TaxID=1763538 RepID=A0A167DJW6_9BACL|nr:demethylmenaquinone methyltransferase [Paenibacillus crassostreae]AOZ91373.1 bifunctional demethylmenaquinone methyltransferase/2-methoxy-6-polyprenyl-1,4-benzoquinol methylase [Paenibacillus crassostreae]OAB74468.1 bifunctional demethylmenaquinone methyltransferase/2-methoxy-6-polyprenyl-1,4-benzoquinol methylase [Paenibacillus crassostreae]
MKRNTSDQHVGVVQEVEKDVPKEQFVQSVFESIATKYDVMNDILSFRRHKAWRKFAMARMDMKQGENAVDICCGTCDWTLSLAEASGSGKIIGLDFSPSMLEVGRRKVNNHKLAENITLIEGNAMSLPFEDHKFDYATIGFGLRNVPDLVQVLHEMKRVVKPGGMVVCLELSKPTWQPFKGIYYFYFEKILPNLGKLFASRYEQYKWLPVSVSLFPGRDELAKIFEQVGLQHVEAHPLTGGIAALHIGIKEI